MRAISIQRTPAGQLDIESLAAIQRPGQGVMTLRSGPAPDPSLIEFAHPFPGGIVSKHPLSGAYRTTGSSSSKKKKTGDSKFPSSDGR